MNLATEDKSPEGKLHPEDEKRIKKMQMEKKKMEKKQTVQCPETERRGNFKKEGMLDSAKCF